MQAVWWRASSPQAPYILARAASAPLLGEWAHALLGRVDTKARALMQLAVGSDRFSTDRDHDEQPASPGRGPLRVCDSELAAVQPVLPESPV